MASSINIGVNSLRSGTWHSVAVTTTGEVYTWGGGGYGQLGHLKKDELEKIAFRPTKASPPLLPYCDFPF